MQSSQPQQHRDQAPSTKQSSRNKRQKAKSNKIVFSGRVKCHSDIFDLRKKEIKELKFCSRRLESATHQFCRTSLQQMPMFH